MTPERTFLLSTNEALARYTEADRARTAEARDAWLDTAGLPPQGGPTNEEIIIGTPLLLAGYKPSPRPVQEWAEIMVYAVDMLEQPNPRTASFDASLRLQRRPSWPWLAKLLDARGRRFDFEEAFLICNAARWWPADAKRIMDEHLYLGRG